MSDEKALLAAIWEHPHDDTVRLVFADWLQENGQPERAEFIRVQCELAELDRWDDKGAELQAREKALLAAHGSAWRAHLPEHWRDSPFGRGFPVLDLSELDFPDLMRLRAKDLAVAPLSRYHYNLRGSEFDRFLKWPGAIYQDLFAPRPRLPDGWPERLAACARLRNASEVAFIDCALAPDEIKVILDTWADRHLTRLALAGTIGDEGIAVVAAHPGAAKVRELDLRAALVKADGIRALGHSPHMKSLRVLNLWNNGFGDLGAIALAGSSLLASIRNLNLGRNQIGDAGISALANSPAVAQLKDLSLSDNDIGVEGLTALARSPFLSQLASLWIGKNPGRGRAVDTELRDRFGAAVRF